MSFKFISVICVGLICSATIALAAPAGSKSGSGIATQPVLKPVKSGISTTSPSTNLGITNRDTYKSNFSNINHKPTSLASNKPITASFTNRFKTGVGDFGRRMSSGFRNITARIKNFIGGNKGLKRVGTGIDSRLSNAEKNVNIFESLRKQKDVKDVK